MQPAAPLPRALDVQRFAAAREQEIRALQAAIKTDEGTKYGAAALPRHLRRRTRSHKPYKHSKRPNAKRKRSNEEAPDGGGVQQQDGGEAEAPWENRRMRRTAGRLQSAAQQACSWDEGGSLRLEPSAAEAAAGASRDSVPMAAKRLETHIWHAKRLAMTQRWGWHLPEGVAGRGLGSRSFLHQLATSAVMHDASYYCPLSLAGASSAALLSVLGSLLGPQSLALLRQRLPPGPSRLAAMGGQTGSSTAAVGGERGAPPSSSAATRPAAAGANSSVPSANMPGSSSSGQDGGGRCVAGSVGWELEAILYHPGSLPGKAIAPVRIMWLPWGSSTTAGAGSAAAGFIPNGAGSGGADRAAAAMDLDMDLPAAASGGSGEGKAAQPVWGGSDGARPEEVKLCIWVHATAAGEALRALQQAAAAGALAMASTAGGGVPADHSGPLVPEHSQGVRVGALNLRRVELRGAAASRVLACALFTHTAQQELTAPAQQQQQQQEELAGVGGARPSGAAAAVASGKAGKSGGAARVVPLPPVLRQLQGGQALQLALADPRLAKPVALGSASATLLPGSPNSAAAASLLSPTSSPPQPLSEAAISSRRQHLRRQMLGLEDGLGLGPELGLGLGPGVRGPAAASRAHLTQGAAGASLAAAMEGVEAPGLPHAAAGSGAEGSRGLGGEGEEDAVRLAAYCPAALVRHDPPGINGIAGWSLVVPGGWVLPVWLALAFAGAKPAGQREWRWAHTVEGRPFFPHDYPDTQAYAATMLQLGEVQRVHAAKRPKGKYTAPAPFPPPWRQLAAVPQQPQPLPQPGVRAVPAAAPATAAPGATASAPAPAAARPAEPPAAAAAAAGSSGAGATTAAFGASSAGAAPADAFPQGWYVVHDDRAGAEAAGLPLASWAPHGAARPVLLGLSQRKPPLLRWQPRQQQEQAGPSQAGAGAGGEGEGDREAVGGGTGVGFAAADVACSSSKQLQEPGSSGAAAAGSSTAQGAPPEPAAAPAAAAAAEGSAVAPGHKADQAAPRALVAVCVHIAKRGTAREGAEIFGDMSWGGAQILGEAAASQATTPTQPPADSQLPAAEGAAQQTSIVQHAGTAQHAGSAQLEGGPSGQPAGGPMLSLLGFVTSELPRGAPKRGGSLGVACCTALWRLRGLQYTGKRRDKGEVSAFVRNPNSTALHPVRLRLLEVWQ